MPAPKGHPLWGNPRKPKKFTPDELWDGACNYFEWCKDNPIMIIEQTKMPQRLDASMMKTMKPAMIKAFLKQTIAMPHDRAYSIEGLCIHLNCSRELFDNYSKDESYVTYHDICKRIREIIDNQHFTGGMSGTFNPGIVARKLGLIDKKQTELNIPNLNISVASDKTKENIQKLAE